MTPVLLSLRIAGLATLAAAVPAVLAGAWLARSRGVPRMLGQALVLSPLVLPPVVTGWALLLLIGVHGPLHALLAPFTQAAAVLAASVVGFPLFARAAQLAFEAIPSGLSEAAETLGASRAEVFLRVTLPLALPGCVVGALLCFARALGEFGATILVAGNVEGVTRTLPLALFSALQRPGGEADAATLALWSLGLSALALLAAEAAGRRAARHTGRA